MILEVVHRVKAKQREIADSAMMYPDSEGTLLKAGKWQGLQEALQIIDELMSEGEENGS